MEKYDSAKFRFRCLIELIDDGSNPRVCEGYRAWSDLNWRLSYQLKRFEEVALNNMPAGTNRTGQPAEYADRFVLCWHELRDICQTAIPKMRMQLDSARYKVNADATNYRALFVECYEILSTEYASALKVHRAKLDSGQLMP